jgi:hypothetical protein
MVDGLLTRTALRQSWVPPGRGRQSYAPTTTPQAPRCPYCGMKARFYTSSAEFYLSGVDYGPLWACLGCKAWVGCHPGTNRPLGRLADAPLRRAKQAAHRAIDRLWQHGPMRRSEAYAWLASRLHIPAEACHIGMFDLDQCRATVQACRDRSA